MIHCNACDQAGKYLSNFPVRWICGARNFHLGVIAQGAWGRKSPSEVQGRRPGRVSGI